MSSTTTNDATPNAEQESRAAQKSLIAAGEASTEDKRIAINGVRAGCAWRRVRTFVEALLLALLLLQLAGTWLVERFSVDGSSMADALRGSHVDIACSDCGLRFAVGVEGAASEGHPAVCPNCGCAAMRIATEEAIAGDGVLIDRCLFGMRQPRRWEIVAFRSPVESRQILVKRVAGLPDEHIQIIDGDVYANGTIVRKSLAEQHAMAILVHDDRYRASSDASTPYWQNEPGSHWKPTSEGYECEFTANEAAANNSAAAETAAAESGRTLPGDGDPPAADSSFIIHHSSFPDCLTYHHIRRNGASQTVEESSVTDVYGYNQTHPLRDVHTVRDLSLSFRLTASGEGTLYLRASDGPNHFVCAVTAEGRATLERDGQKVASGTATAPLCGPTRLVELSLVDRQFQLAIDGQLVVQYPFDPSDPPAGGISQPFAIAGNGLSLRVEGLLIHRDVYYGPPAAGVESAGFAQPVELADDAFFVLSDNSPVGHDSRGAAFGPSVPGKLLVGKPFLAYGECLIRPLPRSAIQVPDLRQIRYIRGPSANNW